MRKPFLAAFVAVLIFIGLIFWYLGPPHPSAEPTRPVNSPAVLQPKSQPVGQDQAPITLESNAVTVISNIVVGTNFGYSNGTSFQNVVTNVVVYPPPLTAEEIEARHAHKKEFIENSLAYNAQHGIEQDRVQREADLKEKAKVLAVGLTREQVIEIMGKPDHITAGFLPFQAQGSTIGATDWKNTQLEALKNSSGKPFDLDYTAYPVEEFLSRRIKLLKLPNLYQNLSVSFDEMGEVKEITWY